MPDTVSKRNPAPFSHSSGAGLLLVGRLACCAVSGITL